MQTIMQTKHIIISQPILSMLLLILLQTQQTTAQPTRQIIQTLQVTQLKIRQTTTITVQ
jgi:hypothetical protein